MTQCPAWPAPQPLSDVAVVGFMASITFLIAAFHYARVWRRLQEGDRAVQRYPEF